MIILSSPEGLPVHVKWEFQEIQAELRVVVIAREKRSIINICQESFFALVASDSVKRGVDGGCDIDQIHFPSFSVVHFPQDWSNYKRLLLIINVGFLYLHSTRSRRWTGTVVSSREFLL